ncbi:MAG: HAMP domain-containing histidine kinase [Bacteroidia bacterium]|nr:HAMP domain-containing histidine kinase [Bacteroidia bacterium]
MKSNYRLFLLVAILMFGGAMISEQLLMKQKTDFEGIAADARHCLDKLEKRSLASLNQIAEKVTAQGLPAVRNYTGDVEGLSISIFRNDSLLWWSDNSVLPKRLMFTPGFYFQKNGWYETFSVKKGDFTFIGMLKIRNQYAFQNRFLSNDFNPGLDIPPSAILYEKEHPGSFAVQGSSGKPLFYLAFPNSNHVSRDHPVIAFIYILGYLLLLLAIYHFVKQKSGSEQKAGLMTLAALIVTRVLSIYFNFPAALYDLSLFSPSYYASSLVLNSLGDLLISALVITYLVNVMFKLLGTQPGNRLATASGFTVPVVLTLLLLFTFLYSVFINYLLAGLIINSRISFNINNVFELNIYSLVGVVIIGILLFSFYLVCDGVVRFIQRTKTGVRKMFILFLITQGVFLLMLLLFRESSLFCDYGISAYLLTNFLVIYSGYIRRNMRNIIAFTRYLLIVFGFSIYAAQTISEFNKVREKENRKLLAGKLENEQDQIAEYLFDDIADKASKDKVLRSFFESSYDQLVSNASTEEVISRRMAQLYFTGYWGKYDIAIKCFNMDGLPINTGGDPTWNLDYFNVIINEESTPTYSPYLRFSGNNAGRISYIGKLPVYAVTDNEVQTGTIIVSLSSKPLQDGDGFPELLISDKIPQKRDISNYSYAHYRNQVLVNQFGKFNYPLNSKSYASQIDRETKEKFVVIEGYSHLIYKTGDEGMLIVSIETPGIMEFVTLFSYLFSFYGFCFILIYAIILLSKNKGQISINFKNRIQATVLIIVVTTMLLIGGATVYYIFNNYVTNLSYSVNERLKSMLIAIQDELSKRAIENNEITDELNYSFSKLAGTLSIDFNIYTPEGRLVYSTQPKIYDQGIISRRMNREALNHLAVDDKSLHIQFEEIGKLRYLSAYEPVRNNNFNTIGYVNLPYFARQDELKKDISSFLVALINIYVLLFAFAIFITFMISSRITKPLQLIQQRLGKIKLGKRNELIEWTHDDEIGSLVKEYNRMVTELSESAELLARSERESAWREMAKQVAHEIKNPLTPMKLGVQHLQRAWKEQSPNLESIMQRFSQTLIEQIDTLSNIATEFSNFAKMPKANNEETDIALILRNCVTLYGENESATITYYEHKSGPFMAYADKEQMMRVFSNLLKNAIQAIPDDRKGHVHVEIKTEGSKLVASIKDNGVGIPEEERGKIFTPNFTTKTGGTGLGLAMVKNIVEQAGGAVWFESEPGTGTTFFVSMPVFNGSIPPLQA